MRKDIGKNIRESFDNYDSMVNGSCATIMLPLLSLTVLLYGFFMIARNEAIGDPVAFILSMSSSGLAIVMVFLHDINSQRPLFLAYLGSISTNIATFSLINPESLLGFKDYVLYTGFSLSMATALTITAALILNKQERVSKFLEKARSNLTDYIDSQLLQNEESCSFYSSDWNEDKDNLLKLRARLNDKAKLRSTDLIEHNDALTFIESTTDFHLDKVFKMASDGEGRLLIQGNVFYLSSEDISKLQNDMASAV